MARKHTPENRPLVKMFPLATMPPQELRSVTDLSKFPNVPEEWITLASACRRSYATHDLDFLMRFWHLFPALLACSYVVHVPKHEGNRFPAALAPKYRGWAMFRMHFYECVEILCVAAEERGLDSSRISQASETYVCHARQIADNLLEVAGSLPIEVKPEDMIYLGEDSYDKGPDAYEGFGLSPEDMRILDEGKRMLERLAYRLKTEAVQRKRAPDAAHKEDLEGPQPESKPRHRPPIYDPKKDAEIAANWEASLATVEKPTKAVFEARNNLRPGELTKIIDRHRHRQRRDRRRTPPE